MNEKKNNIIASAGLLSTLTLHWPSGGPLLEPFSLLSVEPGHFLFCPMKFHLGAAAAAAVAVVETSATTGTVTPPSPGSVFLAVAPPVLLPTADFFLTPPPPSASFPARLLTGILPVGGTFGRKALGRGDSLLSSISWRSVRCCLARKKGCKRPI
jgi:hypothetical protein